MELKTPIYDYHVELGGKIVPFGGFLLPVQYKTGVIAEHKAVREKAGLFDVSHMGEILITGRDALANVNMLLTNDFTVMEDGRCRYSPMCNEEGGIVDDLIVYKIKDECYLIIVNASNTDKDFAWMTAHAFGDVNMENISEQAAQAALQGPLAREIMTRVCRAEELPEKYYTFTREMEVGGIPCLVSRTGYTGEAGYEIYCAAERGEELFRLLLEAGKDLGLIPCGLGARDTLRLEAAMPLYGHEMSDEITPAEADLGFAVKMNKADFIGKKALEEKGPAARKRVGLRITGRGIAREHCDVYIEDRKVGETTSGTFCPHLNHAVAMALLETSSASVGTSVSVDVRGRRIEAEVVSLPFYKRA